MEIPLDAYLRAFSFPLSDDSLFPYNSPTCPIRCPVLLPDQLLVTFIRLTACLTASLICMLGPSSKNILSRHLLLLLFLVTLLISSPLLSHLRWPMLSHHMVHQSLVDPLCVLLLLQPLMTKPTPQFLLLDAHHLHEVNPRLHNHVEDAGAFRFDLDGG
jgi:hypothetical protein